MFQDVSWAHLEACGCRWMHPGLGAPFPGMPKPRDYTKGEGGCDTCLRYAVAWPWCENCVRRAKGLEMMSSARSVPWKGVS